MTPHVPRRRFLRTAALGAASIVAAGSRIARGYPANDAILVGCIGTGGRCLRALMPPLKEMDGVRLTAVCDVWDERLAQARRLAEKDALATKDFHEILDRKEIDAVVVATPDHWHVPVTIAACKAGKDVYVEKPLTHDVAEGPAVIAAQNDNKRVVQVGMQQRSMPQFLRALEIVRSGRLGRIHKVHLTWNRNSTIKGWRQGIDPKTVDWKRFLGSAKDQPFDEYRFRSWRWFWDFGGGILTDLMVHYIDVVNWFCEVEHPQTAWTIGDHFQTAGLWETPDTIQTLLRFPERQLQVYFEGTFSNARNGAMLEFMGTDATLYLDRGRYEIFPERGKGEHEVFSPGKSPRGADFDVAVEGGRMHLENWIECVRSREKPRAPAEAGVAAVTGAHLGNRAYRSGKVANWS